MTSCSKAPPKGRLACPKRADTFVRIEACKCGAHRTYLGIEGTRSVDPLTDVYRALRGSGRIPGYVRCQARKQPGVAGLPRCRNLACPRCHSGVQRGRLKKLRDLFEQLEELGFRLHLVTL